MVAFVLSSQPHSSTATHPWHTGHKELTAGLTAVHVQMLQRMDLLGNFNPLEAQICWAGVW